MSARWNFLWFVALLAPAHAEVLEGVVIGISGGDAITVAEQSGVQHRVKLLGISAPELSEPAGKRSYQQLSGLLYNVPVSVEVRGRDNFHRILGKVALNGRDVAFGQIEAGLAVQAVSALQSDEERSAYASTEDKARSAKLGVWRDESPLHGGRTPPSSATVQCKEIRNTLQCDDGSVFTQVGTRVYGNDGSVYRKRGNTVFGSDGSTFRQRGPVTYGSDGSICRQRGTLVTCH